MADAAIEAGEQGGSLVGDDGGFEIGAREGADGFEGAPGGFNDDFDFVLEASSGNGGAEIARDAAKFGQNAFEKCLRDLGNWGLVVRAVPPPKIQPVARGGRGRESGGLFPA